MVPEAALATATSWEQLQSGVADGTIDIGWHPSILNLTAVIGSIGLVVCGTFFALGRASIAPTNDPRLAEAMAHELF